MKKARSDSFRVMAIKIELGLMGTFDMIQSIVKLLIFGMLNVNHNLLCKSL